MILRELFYFNDDNKDMNQDDRYVPANDDSVIKKGDTRKIRLTLKQINHLRKASDQHAIEKLKDAEFISKMYAPPSAEAAPA
jgi:hypothetical protein